MLKLSDCCEKQKCIKLLILQQAADNNMTKGAPAFEQKYYV